MADLAQAKELVTRLEKENKTPSSEDSILGKLYNVAVITILFRYIIVKK